MQGRKALDWRKKNLRICSHICVQKAKPPLQPPSGLSRFIIVLCSEPKSIIYEPKTSLNEETCAR